MKKNQKCWALVPAGGTGSRVGGNVPKQFVEIAGKTMLIHSLSKLEQSEFVCGIWVGLSSGAQSRDLSPELKKTLQIFDAGPERVDTVLNGLRGMLSSEQVDADDWVLVHDAARPLVSVRDIDMLVETVIEKNAVGGLLANRVVDTLKKASSQNESEQTVNRSDYWCAQTPQMFRVGELKTAIETARGDNVNITDEASAMEASGHKPLLVEASAPNFKVTTQNDLKLATLLLESKQ